MQTFNQSLARLIQSNAVTQEDGLAASTNPGDLRLLLKGVMSGSASHETQRMSGPATPVRAFPSSPPAGGFPQRR